MKKYFVVVGILTVAFLQGCWMGNNDFLSQVTSVAQAKPEITLVSKEGKFPVVVEVARTTEEHEKGLMFREGLEKDSGMLFVYEKPQRQYFWMKNMNFGIDIIFIDEAGKILNIFHNVPPCEEEKCPVYKSDGKGKYVLEVIGGYSKKIGLGRGNQVVIKDIN